MASYGRQDASQFVRLAPFNDPNKDIKCMAAFPPD